MPFVYLSFIAVISALYWHRNQTRFLLASVLSALTATVIFEILAFLESGSLDPFFMIASVLAFGLSFLIAIVLGLFITKNRS